MIGLPFNLFDILFLAILVGGVMRGKRRGVSLEWPAAVRWLVLVVACALCYGPLGALVARVGGFDLLSAYIMAYLAVALLIFLLFSILERRLKPKTEGTDFFGHSEYYLGMGSGLVRFFCVLLTALALLNARAFTPAEVRAMERFQEETYGSSLFPNLHSLQVAVFEKSLVGPWIRSGLQFLLIQPTDTTQKEPAQG